MSRHLTVLILKNFFFATEIFTKNDIFFCYTKNFWESQIFNNFKSSSYSSRSQLVWFDANLHYLRVIKKFRGDFELLKWVNEKV